MAVKTKASKKVPALTGATKKSTSKAAPAVTGSAKKLVASGTIDNTEAFMQNALSFYTKKQVDEVRKQLTTLSEAVKKDKKMASLAESNPRLFVAKYMDFLEFPTEEKSGHLAVSKYVKTLTDAKAKEFVRDLLNIGSSSVAFIFLYNTSILWTKVFFWMHGKGTIDEIVGSQVEFDIPKRVYARFRNELKEMKDLDLTQSRSDALLRRAVTRPTAVLKEKKGKDVITRKIEYKRGKVNITATVRLKERKCSVSFVEVR